MKSLSLIAVSVVVAACVSCTKQPNATATAAGLSSTPTPATPKSEPTEATTKPPGVATIPSEIKTAGFEYYGLSNTKPLPMKGVVTGARRTGAWVNSLIGFDSNKATYEQRFTGTLSELGVNRVTADKSGIYATSVSGFVLDKPQLELPADPQPGFTWKFNVTIKGPNQESILDSGTDKIVGVKKVTAGGKSYDALLVEETGSLTGGGNTANVTARKWLVKGLGPVRQEIHSESQGKKQDIVLEASGS